MVAYGMIGYKTLNPKLALITLARVAKWVIDDMKYFLDSASAAKLEVKTQQ